MWDLRQGKWDQVWDLRQGRWDQVSVGSASEEAGKVWDLQQGGWARGGTYSWGGGPGVGLQALYHPCQTRYLMVFFTLVIKAK